MQQAEHLSVKGNHESGGESCIDDFFNSRSLSYLNCSRWSFSLDVSTSWFPLLFLPYVHTAFVLLSRDCLLIIHKWWLLIRIQSYIYWEIAKWCRYHPGIWLVLFGLWGCTLRLKRLPENLDQGETILDSTSLDSDKMASVKKMGKYSLWKLSSESNL